MSLGVFTLCSSTMQTVRMTMTETHALVKLAHEQIAYLPQR